MRQSHHMFARPLFARAHASILPLSIAMLVVAGCGKHDGAQSASDSSASASTPPSSGTAAGPTDITPMRGTLSAVSDSVLTVSTSAGEVRVAVLAPLHVYARVPAKLASVTPSSFVGVTSVKQQDGSQHATEIHIFPEELRGTGEGSYLMSPQAGSDSSHRSTMTNGTVSTAPKSGEAPRMTNGAVASQGPGTITVQYRGGTQTITVPPGVSVTALASTNAKLASGAKVVVLGLTQPDGTMKASSVVLADSSAHSK